MTSGDDASKLAEHDAIMQARFQRLGLLVLIVGLLAAGVVYFRTASKSEPAGSGYEIVGGKSFAMNPSESKRYEYDMVRIGGKSNLLAAEIGQWFGGLWQGRRLAYTLAVVSIGGSFVCLFLAHLLGLPPAPEEKRDGKDL
jgi:hypothetical protein